MPAQRPVRKAIASKPYYTESPTSDNEAMPSLVPDSDDDDRSEIETPTKSTNKCTIYYEPSDDGSEYEMKPDMSDNEWEGDEKPKLKTPTKGKGAKASGSSRKSNTSSSAGASGSGGTPKKLGQAWTGDEDWALFQYLHPKISKPEWRTAAAVVGRDAKACQNRYAVFGKKLESIIKNGSGK